MAVSRVEVPRSAPASRPRLVSVVLPVLNGEKFLGAQLEALASQRYDGDWEVLVVDNGCSDRSREIARSFKGRLPALRIVDASARHGLNHARNAGVASARGDFLVFCDADDEVAPGWIAALVRAGEQADLVGGAIEVEKLNGHVRAWRREVPLDGLPVKLDFLPAVPGGNCGMWASTARALGFDEEYAFAGSDIEFSWRATLRSYRVAFAPDALISARHRERLRDLVRQQYRYGRSVPHLYRRFRVHGMVRPESRTARREWRWLARNVGQLLGSSGQRGWWLRIAANRTGRLVGSLRFRVLCP
jgi:glycosyltransferase involved in cell wall biosynthesis